NLSQISVKNKDIHNKNTGFNTPKAYFDSFEDRLFERMQTASLIPKDTGFTAPDAYFDTLEDTLSKQLFDTKTETKVIPLQRKRNYINYISYAAAACFVLFLAITFMNTSEEDTISINEVASTEINEFIENDLIALNNYELMTVYEEENIEINTIFEVDLNETETIDYLENTTDPYDLFLEQ
ncbi:MAG: hypothetical protein AAF617_13840, partial [Bacteroidota bacterium]